MFYTPLRADRTRPATSPGAIVALPRSRGLSNLSGGNVMELNGAARQIDWALFRVLVLACLAGVAGA